ncbi:MAG: hypothetical protein ACYSOT_06900, partial [Planctomycetota bacterium]
KISAVFAPTQGVLKYRKSYRTIVIVPEAIKSKCNESSKLKYPLSVERRRHDEKMRGLLRE